MSCPTCKRFRLVEIAFTVGQGRVTMRSCSRCDTRWWDQGGERLALPGLLELAAGR